MMSSKKCFLLAMLFLVSGFGWAQKNPVAEVTKCITSPEVEAHLTFLASDEMRGRDTGSPELEIAANYIAAQFKIFGLKTAPGLANYFQPVALENAHPAKAGELSLGGDIFKFKDDFILFEGGNQEWKGDFVYVGYGSTEELNQANVKGKMVIALAGTKDSGGNPMAIFSAAGGKFQDAKNAGAAGLIEIFASPQVPWPALVNFFASNVSMRVKSSTNGSATHVWLKDSDADALKKIKDGSLSGSLKIEGVKTEPVPTKNVIGMIEGTDPKLKNEFLVVSAHYDHVGVQKNAQPGKDSIFNGARDNAIGVVGLISTAKYLAQYPPKRSVLFIALTGEEKGLLGSKYYAENPVVPLNKTVFNFNCDGAGYNDVTIATIIGMERTTAETDLAKACSAFGIKATIDPVPEQNLFERSDNYNFAVKGVPAITFAPGTKAFDEALLKYYHQPADEVSSLDFTYLIKYFRAYVYANVLLANNPAVPTWKAGDKFEAEAKKLYGK
ncbi:MAG TPA: M28 family peptidase [Cyclobacteriaceae bacterium]|nr:M28 family peptidase [Cyclobacteriaceae bacterium]HRJ82362.1 M28 family peptidase [Cyclobacteriaceae bacterium]